MLGTHLGRTTVSDFFENYTLGENLARLPNGLSNAATVFTLTFLPVVLFGFAVWFQPFVPIEELMRDPLSVAELSDDCCHLHYGFVSNLGVLLWAGAAAVLLFSAIVVMVQRRSKEIIRFHLFAGLLSACLCLDDFFLIHEIVLPSFGISEKFAYLFYGLVALTYFQQSWRQILSMRPFMLFVSLFCLGGSVVIDSFMNFDSVLRLFIEDGLKLIGIAAWFSFHIEAALGFVVSLPKGGSVDTVIQGRI